MYVFSIGLAPARTNKQDQSHISLVSTLLTLMDGLEDRGKFSAIIICWSYLKLDFIWLCWFKFVIDCFIFFIGFIGQVVVIGATNRISALDPALRRPGRFDKEFHFPLPREEARFSLLKLQMKNWNANDMIELTDEFLQKLAMLTTGYCGADIKVIM